MQSLRDRSPHRTSHSRGSSSGGGSSPSSGRTGEPDGEGGHDSTSETKENLWKKPEPDFVSWNYCLTPGPKRPFVQSLLH